MNVKLLLLNLFDTKNADTVNKLMKGSDFFSNKEDLINAVQKATYSLKMHNLSERELNRCERPLDSIFSLFQDNAESGHRSLMCGDVIIYEEKVYFIDFIGFVEL